MYIRYKCLINNIFLYLYTVSRSISLLSPISLLHTYSLDTDTTYNQYSSARSSYFIFMCMWYDILRSNCKNDCFIFYTGSLKLTSYVKQMGSPPFVQSQTTLLSLSLQPSHFFNSSSFC